MEGSLQVWSFVIFLFETATFSILISIFSLIFIHLLAICFVDFICFVFFETGSHTQAGQGSPASAT